MSLISFLSNSNKILTLSMIILELCEASQIPIAVVGFIIFCVVISFLFTKLRKKSKPFVEKKFETDESFASSENAVLADMRKHSFLLKRIGDQITRDRMCLMRKISQDQSAFQEHILKKLEWIQSSVLETLSKTLEQKKVVQNQHTEEIVRTLDELQSEFLTTKNLLQYAPFSSFYLTFSSKAPVKYHEQNNEVFSTELLNNIEITSKEYFTKLESETRTKGKEIIQSISRFLEQSHKDIQKELSIFSSAVESNEKGGNKTSNSSFISKVEKIEKNLLNTFVYLNRQRFEMENLQKILNHFDIKFNYVAAKFDAYWNQSKSAYSTAAKRLEITEGLWVSASKKMDNSSGCLVQQSKSLTAITGEIENILKFKQHDSVFLSSFKQPSENVNDNSDNVEISLIRNIEMFNDKFEDLFLISENTKDKLFSLSQSSKNLQSFQNLINTIAEGYNSLLSFFWPSLKLRTVGEKFSTGYEKHRESLDKWVEICRALSDMGNEKCTIDTLWDEIRDELSKEYQNMDIDNIISILKDIVKITWDLVDHRKNVSEKDIKKKNACGKNFEESEQWRDIPTESLLSEMSSDCLIQNSDESESESVDNHV